MAVESQVIELGGDELLTVVALAQRLGASEDRIRQLIADGHIPVWQPGGPNSTVYVSAKRLAQWIYDRSTPRRSRAQPLGEAGGGGKDEPPGPTDKGTRRAPPAKIKRSLKLVQEG